MDKVAMTQPIAALLKAGAWAAALFGVLSLQYLPDRFFGEHSVCGPWGCGAPLPALLACHGFWLVLFAPATVYAARQLKPQTVWRLGAGLVSLAGLGLVAVAVSRLRLSIACVAIASDRLNFLVSERIDSKSPM